MPLNVELLEKVKAHVLEEPRRVRMEAWGISLHMSEAEKDRARYDVLEDLFVLENDADYEDAETRGFAELIDFPECGTVACIAGWGKILSQPDPAAAMRDPDFLRKLSALPAYESEALFGVTHQQADRLFFVARWPRKFERRYEGARSATVRARVVADRIDHFIKTNGAE